MTWSENIDHPNSLTIIEQPQVRSPSPAPAAPTVNKGAGSSAGASRKGTSRKGTQPWTDEEERLLKGLRLKNPTEEWQLLADKLLTGRTRHAVSQHWQVHPLSTRQCC